MTSTLAIKKQILKEINNFGLAGSVNDDALSCITTFLQEQGNGGHLQALLQLCLRDRPSSGDINRSVVEASISQLLGQGQGVDLVAFINAQDVPKISYDAVGRKMFADSLPRTLFADAAAKQRLYLDRLQLITQRMRRNKFFQQNYQVLAGASDHPSAQLTDLQSLKGVEGQQRFVMGCVARGEDGVRLVLEDATGSMPLDISGAQWPAGFFTDNSIVIAQGVLSYEGVFHAQQLGLPPVEVREDLAEASKRLNFFGGPNLSSDELAVLSAAEASGKHREDRIVVAANVWLDKRETLDRISKLLEGFQEVAIVPPLFVFMGNFHSKAPAVAGSMSASQRAGGGGAGAVDYASLKQGFAALAALIDQFPRIKANSRFVFVPGPGDPSPSDVLPQPPLPSHFTADILRVCPNAIFASNPCRIRYLSSQIVLFRYDILKRLRRRCLLPISGGEPATPEAMWQHLALTLLQQSHLCPLPLLHQPIYWQQDHALALYPLPHAVVVADMSPQAAHTHGGCTVFTPGSFTDGFFAAFVPGQQAVELSEMPKDGDLPHDESSSDMEEEEVLAQEAPRPVGRAAGGRTAAGSAGTARGPRGGAAAGARAGAGAAAGSVQAMETEEGQGEEAEGEGAVGEDGAREEEQEEEVEVVQEDGDEEEEGAVFAASDLASELGADQSPGGMVVASPGRARKQPRVAGSGGRGRAAAVSDDDGFDSPGCGYAGQGGQRGEGGEGVEEVEDVIERDQGGGDGQEEGWQGAGEEEGGEEEGGEAGDGMMVDGEGGEGALVGGEVEGEGGGGEGDGEGVVEAEEEGSSEEDEEPPHSEADPDEDVI